MCLWLADWLAGRSASQVANWAVRARWLVCDDGGSNTSSRQQTCRRRHSVAMQGSSVYTLTHTTHTYKYICWFACLCVYFEELNFLASNKFIIVIYFDFTAFARHFIHEQFMWTVLVVWLSVAALQKIYSSRLVWSVVAQKHAFEGIRCPLVMAAKIINCISLL